MLYNYIHTISQIGNNSLPSDTIHTIPGLSGIARPTAIGNSVARTRTLGSYAALAVALVDLEV